jgi:hypothetical protein
MRPTNLDQSRHTTAGAWKPGVTLDLIAAAWLPPGCPACCQPTILETSVADHASRQKQTMAVMRNSAASECHFTVAPLAVKQETQQPRQNRSAKFHFPGLS